jgi:hypothetical protein
MRGMRWTVAWVAVACGVVHANPGNEKPDKNKAAEAPKRLLDAPNLQTRAKSLAAFGGGGADIRVSWSAVSGAVRYHVMWAGADGKPTDTWSQRLTFQKQDVKAGRYTLTVAAVDTNGMEGALSAPLAFDIAEVVAVPPGSTAPQPPVRGAYAVGTVFSVPGKTCTLGGQTLSRPDKQDATKVRATSAGLGELHCDSISSPVVIAPVTVGNKEAPLPRGETTTVHVSIGSVASVGDQIEVVGIGGAKPTGPVKRTPMGLDVALAIAPDAEAAAIAIKTGGLELGRTGFDLTDRVAPPPPPPPPGSAAAAFDLAFAAGAFVPTASGMDPAAPAIGRPTTTADVVGAGVSFGPRLGLYLVPRVGIEAELDMLTLPVSDERVLGLAVRGQLAIRALESKYFGARLIAGAGSISIVQGARTVTPQTSGEVHYGLGLALVTTPGVSLRADALDVVTTSESRGYAHNLELELAVVARFGRRDHW